MPKTRTIRVDSLARVEGEGSLTLDVRDGELVDARLDIFEPPRFFEALLRGRSCEEAPDITARICGICPVAYQMSAVGAVEDALGLTVSRPIHLLRRLLYCGEWIESHSLHVFMLHAPDFLGFEGAISMARKHPDLVRRGLRLKQVGNAIMSLLGGREVHPINVKVGGFYRVPSRAELRALAGDLAWAREAAQESVRWAAKLPVPDLARNDERVALRGDGEYPFDQGTIVSDRGLEVESEQFEEEFIEEHAPHTTALQARRRDGRSYLVGPMARFALNRERLSPGALEAADEAGLDRASARNPFRSIVIRCVEILYACEEALRLIEEYDPPDAPTSKIEPRAGVGHAATEAPRGILYHRYRLDDRGIIQEARIVPPTSQNQHAIEQDLHAFASSRLELSEEELRHGCEQTIRNYDPCISCATHFLDLRVNRQ